MNPHLKAYLMPWKQPTRLWQVTGTLCLTLIPLTVVAFFVPSAVVVVVVMCMVVAGLAVVGAIQQGREMHQHRDRLINLIAARAVDEGKIEFDELPPEIQEGIRIEQARYRLAQQGNSE